MSEVFYMLFKRKELKQMYNDKRNQQKLRIENMLFMDKIEKRNYIRSYEYNLEKGQVWNLTKN